jgi:hypothetical protein
MKIAPLFLLPVLAASVGAQAQSMTQPPYVPSPQSSWLLLTTTIANTSPGIAPFAFKTEADCKAAATKVGAGARCINATVIR